MHVQNPDCRIDVLEHSVPSHDTWKNKLLPQNRTRVQLIIGVKLDDACAAGVRCQNKPSIKSRGIRRQQGVACILSVCYLGNEQGCTIIHSLHRNVMMQINQKGGHINPAKSCLSPPSVEEEDTPPSVIRVSPLHLRTNVRRHATVQFLPPQLNCAHLRWHQYSCLFSCSNIAERTTESGSVRANCFLPASLNSSPRYNELF